ncbi:hypothetical protein [Bosea sp. (in: a-proteobacteria)]|uniref:hypothetical protein n=1 Tax=Bosea sp. (in: a-proteobacteria) TaxID=1871050 RepID=UPI0025BDBA6B|nr:hypothetical protein [Bosea sp. (in: a-proteobacteria)]MBR3189776.1 hypothetical protein [Bosea sp. (in: a-proteobacteria)]
MKKLLLASAAALALSAVPAVADTTQIFGNASAKILTPDANKKVVGKGYYADYYGYYGYYYSYYANYYAYYGYVYSNADYYYNAYYYSYYATQYLYNAYYYQYYNA